MVIPIDIEMKRFKILGITFHNGNYKEIIDNLKYGGLMVVPSGPGLATIGKDLIYTEAMQNADFAIPDSGYMILLIKVLRGLKIKNILAIYS